MVQSRISEDLIAVGYVSGAYGIAGWVRIQPYSDDADALLNVRKWWLGKPESPDLRDIDMLQAKSHGGDVVAQLMGVADRNASEALKGYEVRIARSHFPVLSGNEFYWIDLIGLPVENLQGEQLGVVADLMDNGAHPILRVIKPAAESAHDGETSKAPETLIPFVDHFVKTVDQTAKKITVDWGQDF